MSLLHSLFTREHNSICDGLRKQNPGWSDEAIYVKARLVNAALMAKIHTVEWTPAILPNPTTKLALEVNWHGIAKDLQNVFRFLDDSEVFGGNRRVSSGARRRAVLAHRGIRVCLSDAPADSG
jgi:hypothetical protein